MKKGIDVIVGILSVILSSFGGMIVGAIVGNLIDRRDSIGRASQVPDSFSSERSSV